MLNFLLLKTDDHHILPELQSEKQPTQVHSAYFQHTNGRAKQTQTKSIGINKLSQNNKNFKSKMKSNSINRNRE
jgi:hypothetical protein